MVEKEIGEPIHDMVLGETFNDNPRLVWLSEFKGKLIILDFWNTRCASCIEAFPKMKSLQDQFNDKIQIILVNADETADEVSNYLKERKGVIELPDLPSVVSAYDLKRMFPHFYSGFHVWIDTNFIVRLKGHPINTNADKINDYLRGGPITFVKEGKFYTVEDGPLITLYESGHYAPMSSNSIYPYNDEYGSVGGDALNVIDPLHPDVVRNTYINRNLLELYNEALFKGYVGTWKDQIIRPYTISWLDKFILKVSDTSRYTDAFLKNRTDKDWLKSRFCYEQVVPGNMPEFKRRQSMFEDLNRYFGNQYGTEVKIVQLTVLCYVITKTGEFQEGRLKMTDRKKSALQLSQKKATKKMVRWQDWQLSSILQPYCRKIFGQERVIVLDETNFTKLIDIIIPDVNEIKTLDDLKDCLKQYGIDIIKDNRKLDFVELTEKLN